MNTEKDGYNYIAMVLGAGVVIDENGKYYPGQTLKLRLDKSIELLENGKVNKIIVTGDNRYIKYNEPEVMKNYLISMGVNQELIIEDFAGRRTADSCWRVKNVFKAKNVYIVTQAFHMPRSQALCEYYGLNTRIAIAQDANKVSIINNLYREVGANWLAIKDIAIGYQAEIKADGSEPSLMQD